MGVTFRWLSRLEIEVPWDDLRGMSAIGGGETREDYTRVNVNLTSEELTRSLRDVPRSVTEEAVEQFIMDIKRDCGSAVASQFEQRLGFEG